MNNRILLTKAFNDLKDLFNLKDICVTFWSSEHRTHQYRTYQYRSRPYLMAITDDDQHIALNVADPYHRFDYAYVDEFDKSKYIPDSPFVEASVSIQPWQIAESLFNIAQQPTIYLFMPNIDPYYCDEKQYILLKKGVQLTEFLVYADLNTQHGC